MVVDTSIWIDFFRGVELPALERALKDGAVVVPPLVVAELLSSPLSPRERSALTSMLRDLELHPTPFEHWQAVGELRSSMRRKGITVSSPDAHIAQCAIDRGVQLWSRDAIFATMAKKLKTLSLR